MSNESLNDFYNQNRFNKKLRERIDSFEPELSDSLWDRIEHDLVKKENRGKRVVWMVYVMAGLLLLSGVGIYHLATENKKLADAVKEQGAVEDLPLYTMPEVEVDPNAEAISTDPALGNTLQVQEPPVQVQASTENRMTTPGTYLNTPGVEIVPVEVAEEAQNGREEVVSPDFANDLEAGKESNLTESPLSAMSLNGKPAPAFQVHADKPGTNFLNTRKGKSGIYPRVQPFIGLSSEVGSNRQLVDNPNAYRFDYEHPFMFQSHGLEFGVLFRNGWFVQSGIRSTTTGTNIWYDVAQKIEKDSTPGKANSDSLVIGDKHTVNQQNWIEIPVQLGYVYRLNSKWAITGQAGLTYSIINRYSGVQPNPTFNAFDIAGAQQPQPFKNYWSITGGAGIAYQIGRNWMIDLQGQYRRGLQNFNSVQELNHPNRKNEMLSGKLGVRYILR